MRFFEGSRRAWYGPALLTAMVAMSGFVFLTLPFSAIAFCAENGSIVAADIVDEFRWNSDDPAFSLWRIHGVTMADESLPWTTAPRCTGVSGVAISFVEPRRIAVDGLPWTTLETFSISAWVRPDELTTEQYREIYRQENGDERLLFSFQEYGQVLSFGANIGGYVECDAPISVARLEDGTWHHVAATFDGAVMRVYFDGDEIGSLDRSGTIRCRVGGASAYIGSSGGTGEFYLGELDDLRIGRKLRSVSEIAEEYRTGASRVLNSPEEFIVAERLRRRIAGRLLQLAEFRPLTDEQWDRCPPNERQKWDAVAALEAEYERLSSAMDTVTSTTTEQTVESSTVTEMVAAWTTLLKDVDSRMVYRPFENEPVAPYHPPMTPPTRPRTVAEADELLRQDWLHQVDGKPTSQQIAMEIHYARELLHRRHEEFLPGPLPENEVEKYALIKNILNENACELDVLERQISSDPTMEDAALYREVRRVKRRIMLLSPALDFEEILLVDGPYPEGSEWQHEMRHYLGHMAVPGGRLLLVNGFSPDSPVRSLAPTEPLHGSFWRPDLSWGADRVVFSFKPHNEHAFHIYEINIDGTGLRQITEGIYDDFDPVYLPDNEHIVFTTTRGNNYVRCMPPTNSSTLARCDLSGRDMYLLSHSGEPDYQPSVLPDGRILHTRWEYTDKPLWRAQKLWTMNPDGTYPAMYWGNQSVWPDLLKDPHPIPGSERVMMTGSAHHDWFAGSVGIVDVRKGLNFPDGLTKVTADTPWPECGDGPVDPVESASYHAAGAYYGYYSPYPLSEREFLVSASRGGKFVLYLMDVDGNRELIYEGEYNIFHAMPVKRRERPPVIPDRVEWPTPETRNTPSPGTIYSTNVYQNAPTELRDRAAFLRVLSIDVKTYSYWYKRPYISTGPVVSAVQSDGVKRVLGTVPIDPDGSVSFMAPSGLALHFQLLDADGLALQTMRSFVGVMPGESRGCLGCHEMHSRAPEMPAASDDATALRRPPSPIFPPSFADTTVSYDRYVQPVLDRYCGECHQGDGEARATLDLTRRAPPFHFQQWGGEGATRDPSDTIWHPDDLFCEPYWTLIGRPAWGAPQPPLSAPPPAGFGIARIIPVEAFGQTDPAAYQTPKPMEHLSYASPLVKIISGGEHHGVQVDPESRERIILWIDTMAPYLGDPEVRAIDDPIFQGVDWLPIRPRIRTAPIVIRPGPIEGDSYGIPPR